MFEKIKERLKSLYAFFLNKEYGIKLKIFNVMFILLVICAIIATITTCIIDFDPMILAVMILTVLSVSFGLWLANYKKKINAAGIVVSVMLNIILQPVLFLTTGGRISGMPLWALLGFVFNWLVVDGLACYLLYACGAAAFIMCMLIEEYQLIDVYRIPTEQGQVADVFVAILFVSIILGVIYKYQSKTYEKQRKEIIAKDKRITNTLDELEKTNKELEEASKAKSEFLANMSHEIRTPINAILGMNEMISRETTEDSISDYSDNIQSAGDILLSLVNDILDYSKIGSGKMTLVEEEYDTASQINGLINLIELKANAKNLKFIINVDPKFPCKLYGDEMRIKQIITNLLTNAVKYTKEGSVTLDIDCLEVDEGVLTYKVSISDTGIGIKDEDLEKLFQSFTRLEEQRNKNIEGTGLGIAISQSLLLMMNSTLNVDSIYGKGSKFWFILKQKVVDNKPIGNLGEVARQNKAQKIKNNFIATKATILVVDDVELNLKVAKGLLRPLGMNIVTALSGEDAIELCKKERYDIVFMDHMMPEMDGIEATSIIRKIDSYYAQVPIIALTANAVVGAKEMFLSAGMDDFISKPINTMQINKTIEKYLPKDKIEYIDGSDYESDDIEIPEIEGIDVEKGIAILGSEKLFMETLRSFFDTIDEKIQILEECENINDIESYSINVHSLKTIARTIGATELADIAAYAEQCCKEINIFELKRKSPELILCYKSYKKRLEKVFGLTEQDKIVEVTNEILKEKFERLAKCIDDYMLESAEEVVCEIRLCNIREDLKHDLDKVSESIDMINFKEARALIDTIISKI